MSCEGVDLVGEFIVELLGVDLVNEFLIGLMG